MENENAEIWKNKQKRGHAQIKTLYLKRKKQRNELEKQRKIETKKWKKMNPFGWNKSNVDLFFIYTILEKYF